MTTNARSAADTGLPTLTRRAALAGLALGASSIAAGAALAVPVEPHPDAALLALAAEIRRIATELVEKRPPVDEGDAVFVQMLRDYTEENGTGPDNETMTAMFYATHDRDKVAECNAMGDRLCALSDELRALPAVGLAGLAAKAVGLMWDVGSTSIFDESIPENDRDFNDEALRAFARMLDEMARACHG